MDAKRLSTTHTHNNQPTNKRIMEIKKTEKCRLTLLKGFYILTIANGEKERFTDLSEALKRFNFISRVQAHWL